MHKLRLEVGSLWFCSKISPLSLSFFEEGFDSTLDLNCSESL